MEKEKIQELVLTQVREIVLTFDEDKRFEVNENTILFGKGSSIDSLSLVSVIVDIEALFSDEYGFNISLTDDRAMIREISPFESISSLVNYIFEIISEK
jgi:acyl carrier protein